MEIYILYQTDLWKSHASRVFFGVFTTEERARKEASVNNLQGEDSDFYILNGILNEFGEL